MDWTCEGAREDVEELLCCGWPFAQAACDGSCAGVLADAVEPLLIVQDKKM